jgi:hypothetical protein
MAPWQGLLLAILAGVAVWGAYQAILPVFELSEELAALQGPAIAPRLQEIQDNLRANRFKNAAVGMVIMGFGLGLVLTVGELMIRRSHGRAIWGGLLAGLIAGGISFGAASVGNTLSDALGPTGDPTAPSSMSPLVKTMVVQGAVLGMIGLGVGLAMSVPMLSPRPLGVCLFGCLLGGLLAAVVFAPTVGLLLPHENTEELMPDSRMGQLLWVGLTAGLIGITVTGLGKERPAA